MQPPRTNTIPATGFPNRIPRCIWCDSTDHTKRQCTELTIAAQKGLIRYNLENRIVNGSTGQEIPQMFNRGGMKKLFETQPAPSTFQTNNISLEPVAELGNSGTVHVVTLDFDGEVRTDEIIDVDVLEKRRRDEVLRRRVRPRTDNIFPAPVRPASDVQMSNEPPASQLSETGQPSQNIPFVIIPPPLPPANRPAPPPANRVPEPPKKFRLASELSETVSVAQVCEQLMDTPLQLSWRQVMAVSPEVANYLHDQTRKRRVPIQDTTTASTEAYRSEAPNAPISSSVNSAISQPLYACASGPAPTTLDDRLKTSALLDNGSEINMMTKKVFDKIDLPIDRDIQWRINAYDTKTNDALNSAGAIGVCHDVPVDVGGVKVPQAIFVVEYANTPTMIYSLVDPGNEWCELSTRTRTMGP